MSDRTAAKIEQRSQFALRWEKSLQLPRIRPTSSAWYALTSSAWYALMCLTCIRCAKVRVVNPVSANPFRRRKHLPKIFDVFVQSAGPFVVRGWRKLLSMQYLFLFTQATASRSTCHVPASTERMELKVLA
jgi:hypothetical protein